jgi:hypothetical protein
MLRIFAIAELKASATIETISKILGPTMLSSTMFYTRVTETKSRMDMSSLQDRLDNNKPASTLRIVKLDFTARAPGQRKSSDVTKYQLFINLASYIRLLQKRLIVVI